MPDLLYSAQLIYSSNFLTIPLLIVACAWYLIVTTLLSIGQYFIERRYSRGSGPVTGSNPLASILGWINRVLQKTGRGAHPGKGA